MCRYKSNCTTIGLLKPGMIIRYHDEDLKIIKLLERKLTPSGLICKYKVYGGNGILSAHSGLRVKVLTKMKANNNSKAWYM
ncbi:hypothetical protein [Arsenophonus nasoniae]|uniref:Uncharacterized protein n=1 Tax=Arsenophonus nasoniae TaxID=638 RepID=A0AA95GBJ8_9GAMM|nr:hypothetical protein [Arsenophonus nasoniae]WGL95961.1 hypothetical protein QE207_05085 [Arsenophonus nasoniae]WGL96699.1 hypothetical protein QE207_09290 [Arsenophonus nasoniae]